MIPQDAIHRSVCSACLHGEPVQPLFDGQVVVSPIEDISELDGQRNGKVGGWEGGMAAQSSARTRSVNVKLCGVSASLTRFRTHAQEARPSHSGRATYQAQDRC